MPRSESSSFRVFAYYDVESWVYVTGFRGFALIWARDASGGQ